MKILQLKFMKLVIQLLLLSVVKTVPFTKKDIEDEATVFLASLELEIRDWTIAKRIP